MQPDVAIVGAGLAGIACARALTRQGRSVVSFDKGRKPGGRLSSRRASESTFDHGAPLFTATSPSFREVVEGWAEEGFVCRWPGRFVTISRDGSRPWDVDPWVGVPTMSAVPRALAEGLDVRAPVRVGQVVACDGGWALSDEGGAPLGVFGTVVINTPAGQAVPLLPEPLRERARAAEANMQPCWTVMFVPAAPWDPGFDGARFEAGPLSRAFSQASKPGRGALPGWVLHARGDWTATHWDDDPEDVVAMLIDAVGGPVDALSFSQAHRWRYARATAGVDDGFLWDAATGIGACGDWCGGPGVEGAWRSGTSLAARIESSARTRV